MAYPRQLRLSALPCESQVFEEAVIQMRTHCTFTGAVASCSVTVPPLPLVTTPPGNACHEPCAGFLMGSSPVQYCARGGASGEISLSGRVAPCSLRIPVPGLHV